MSKLIWRGDMRRAVLVLLLALLCTATVSGTASAATLPPGDTGVVDASGDTGTAQTEQTLAVDPSDPRNVMIAEIGDCLSISHDGGRTWKLNNVYNNCTADNNPAFDSHGTAYFYIDDGGLFKSSDHGDTFAPGVRIAGNNGGDVPDRPWFVVDQSKGPTDGTQYLSYESFFTNPLGWIYVVSSADNYAEHRVDDMTNYPATWDPRNLPVVGSDGTLYIVYAEGHAGFTIPQQPEFPISFVVARSSDHGATFRYAFAAQNITRSSAPTEENEAISSLAADPDPLRAGHLALAWADQRTGTSRILLADSVDGGVTWSKPVEVTDDPGQTDNEDHVQVRFLPDGRIAMVWRDRRCCGGAFTDNYNLYARTLAMSDTGDLTPGPVVQVTDSPQAPNAEPNLDEYLGFSAGPEGLSVAWNQPRNGVAATYFRRMPLSEFGTPAQAPPSVSVVAPQNGASYPQGSVVTASYTCQAGAGATLRQGAAGCAGPVPSGQPIDTSTAGTHTFTVTATDADGQTAAGTSTYTVTSSSASGGAPAVLITAPADGASYARGATVVAGFSCQPGTGGTLESGAAGCSGTVPAGQPIDTGSAGTHSFTVRATDTDGQSSSATVQYHVTAGPARTAKPLASGRPKITGTPTPGSMLSCSTGSWTNHPTGFSYGWSRDGRVIAGAMGPAYLVRPDDVGRRLTCSVSASNAAGSSFPVVSAPRLISRVGVTGCARASGVISGRSLGPVRLGESRALLRRLLRGVRDRRSAYTDVFCFTPIGIRVGFPPPAAERRLGTRTRRAVAGRVVLILTANRHYSLHGVRPGARLKVARRHLRLSRAIRSGVNTWYTASARRATAVLKVRGGVVLEVGIADPRLTARRSLTRVFLSSF